MLNKHTTSQYNELIYKHIITKDDFLSFFFFFFDFIFGGKSIFNTQSNEMQVEVYFFLIRKVEGSNLSCTRSFAPHKNIIVNIQVRRIIMITDYGRNQSWSYDISLDLFFLGS